MIRSLCFLVSFAVIGSAAQADETLSSNNLPVGVIIYDAVPSETVLEPSVVPLTQSRASTRSSFAQPLLSQPVGDGTTWDSAVITPQIDLAPGETVLQVFTAPSAIVKIPAVEPAYTLTSGPAIVTAPQRRVAPEPVLDPVRGRLRDTAGWTGSTEGPASIGCFPEGACAVLNRR